MLIDHQSAATGPMGVSSRSSSAANSSTMSSDSLSVGTMNASHFALAAAPPTPGGVHFPAPPTAMMPGSYLPPMVFAPAMFPGMPQHRFVHTAPLYASPMVFVAAPPQQQQLAHPQQLRPQPPTAPAMPVDVRGEAVTLPAGASSTSTRSIDFSKRKTKICHTWAAGACEWGKFCAFAHGVEELEPRQ